MTFNVTQDHWQLCYLIQHTRHRISCPLQSCIMMIVI